MPGRFAEGFSTVFGGREPGFPAEHTREVAGIGKSAELPRFGDGALGVLQDIHRAVDADQHLELAGRHARVSTELAQGSKLVDMDDLGDLREGAGGTAFAQALDGPARQVLKRGVHHGNGLDVIRGPDIGPPLSSCIRSVIDYRFFILEASGRSPSRAKRA